MVPVCKRNINNTRSHGLSVADSFLAAGALRSSHKRILLSGPATQRWIEYPSSFASVTNCHYSLRHNTIQFNNVVAAEWWRQNSRYSHSGLFRDSCISRTGYKSHKESWINNNANNGQRLMRDSISVSTLTWCRLPAIFGIGVYRSLFCMGKYGMTHWIIGV